MKAVITRTKGPPVSVTINVPTPAGIGPFAEKTLVAGDQCVKADPSARPAAVGLLDSGVMAGIGAAINTGAVIRGTSVAVIGCGGVGVAAIAGSALAGAYGRDARPRAARRPHRRRLPVRVLQRILAVTAAVWPNDATGQPVMRSRVVYDH